MQRFQTLQPRKLNTNFDQIKQSPILDFLRDTLRDRQPTEDYRFFFELNGTFLAEAPYRALGAMHHASLMEKAIYLLKMFIFPDEFEV